MPGGVQDATRALLDRIEDRGAINLATAADLGCLRVELEKQAEADTLFDDPFPLLKILSSCFNATLHDEATPIWSTIAETSSPKEVILGLEEILAGIRFSDRDDSDDADSDDSNESDRSETENHEAIRALVTYVRTYRIALTRLETAKADKFYSTAFETIGTVLIHLGIQGKLMSAQTSDLDLDLVEAVWDLACAGASVRDEQQKDRILEPARAFTETTLALLCSTISLHDKANDFFLSRQPRYQFSKPAVPEPAMSLRNEKKRRLWSTYLPV
ncbi:uncharacterized protein JCM15063_003025 [Sporobolomyces koalae]|uniref:uncharacterized protein n=1 Tax=Sporobolomyces koalae TaxID=500713 RepID=UPI0031801DF1